VDLGSWNERDRLRTFGSGIVSKVLKFMTDSQVVTHLQAVNSLKFEPFLKSNAQE